MIVRASSNSAELPEPFVAQWFNAPPEFSLGRLRGSVVALHTFQMLCPGCVLHSIPQMQRLEQLFSGEAFQVVGLHTVFEHHEAMTPVALEAFLHEYRITHPVGVDEPSDDTPIPKTMAQLRLRGTPSLLLIDAQGLLRFSQFGRLDDLFLGALVGSLLSEAGERQPTDALESDNSHVQQEAGCDSSGCSVGS